MGVGQDLGGRPRGQSDLVASRIACCRGGLAVHNSPCTRVLRMGNEGRFANALLLQVLSLEILGNERGGRGCSLCLGVGERGSLHSGDLQSILASASDVEVRLPIYQVAVDWSGQIRADDGGEIAFIGVSLLIEMPCFDEACEASLHLDLAILTQLDVGDVVVVADGGDGANNNSLSRQAAHIQGIAVLHMPPNGMIFGPFENTDWVEGPGLQRIGNSHTTFHNVHPIGHWQEVGAFWAIYAGFQAGTQHGQTPRSIGVEELCLLCSTVGSHGILQGQFVKDSLSPEAYIQQCWTGGRSLGHSEAPRTPIHTTCCLQRVTACGVLSSGPLRHIPMASLLVEGANPDVSFLMSLHEVSSRVERTLATIPNGGSCPMRRIH
mmetsp:Transcript_45487/g.97472  ORF Transcript_45487/g.97472 Transcript_45487/m.97472 type:complete len:379 (-) Transcript_45487:921-2057(-)